MKPVQFISFDKPISDEELSKNRKSDYRLMSVDYDFCLYLRTLEHNKDFVNWLKKLRIGAHIPEDGYDWQKNFHYFPNLGFNKKYSYYLEEEDSDYLLDRLLIKYKFTLKKEDWENIIVCNAIDLPFVKEEKLKLLPVRAKLTEGPVTHFRLYFEERFNKKELHDFIDEEWFFIERSLPKEEKSVLPDYRLKEKDIFFLDKRERKDLTFRQIADEIPDLFKQKGITYTEDNAKTAYRRAKEKAELAFNIGNRIDISILDYNKFLD